MIAWPAFPPPADLGALPLIQNNGVLAAAAAILAVEAYHAGATRTKLYDSIGEYLFPYGVTTGEGSGQQASWTQHLPHSKLFAQYFETSGLCSRPSCPHLKSVHRLCNNLRERCPRFVGTVVLVPMK